VYSSSQDGRLCALEHGRLFHPHQRHQPAISCSGLTSILLQLLLLLHNVLVVAEVLQTQIPMHVRNTDKPLLKRQLHGQPRGSAETLLPRSKSGTYSEILAVTIRK